MRSITLLCLLLLAVNAVAQELPQLEVQKTSQKGSLRGLSDFAG